MTSQEDRLRVIQSAASQFRRLLPVAQRMQESRDPDEREAGEHVMRLALAGDRRLRNQLQKVSCKGDTLIDKLLR